MTASESAQ